MARLGREYDDGTYHAFGDYIVYSDDGRALRRFPDNDIGRAQAETYYHEVQQLDNQKRIISQNQELINYQRTPRFPQQSYHTPQQSRQILDPEYREWLQYKKETDPEFIKWKKQKELEADRIRAEQERIRQEEERKREQERIERERIEAEQRKLQEKQKKRDVKATKKQVEEYIACPKCGRKIRANSVMCPHCYVKVGNYKVEPYDDNKKKRKSCGCIVFIILLLAGGFVLLTNLLHLQ